MSPNTKGLKPFKHGHDARRNINGRPKLPDLREVLARVLAEEKGDVTAVEAILRILRAKAAKGDIRAAEVLLDRAYGKAIQPTDITSGGQPVRPPIAWIPVQPIEPPK